MKTDLVDVVMNVLACNDGGYRARLLGLANSLLVMEASSLLFETCLDSVGIAMVVFPMLNTDEVVSMLLREDFTMLNRLYGGVVVVLVDLAVYGSSGLFMLGRLDHLVRDCRSHFLVDGGVMVASFVPKVHGLASDSDE